MTITAKVLGGIVAALTLLAATLATYNGKVTITPVDTAFGAISTLDGVDSPYVTIGGQRNWIGRLGMQGTSSAFCVLKNPLGVPATIEEASFTQSTNQLGAIAIDFATSSNGFATSSGSILGRTTLPAAGTAGNFAWVPHQASTTPGTTVLGGFLLENGNYENGSSRFILGSSEYLVFRTATTSLGGSTFGTYSTGTCGFNLRAI